MPKCKCGICKMARFIELLSKTPKPEQTRSLVKRPYKRLQLQEDIHG